jgi:ribosomal protein L7/L12
MELGLLLGVIAALMALTFSLSRIERQLQQQDVKLAKLLVHLGLDTDTLSEPSDAVKQLARTPGRYVAAIKAYRHQTGVGLNEAKSVIDRLSQTGSAPAG